MYNTPNLKRKETEPASIWVQSKYEGHREYTEGENCICFADKIGAMYYALKHNYTYKHTVPILIEAIIDIKNVFVDGRDSLYTIFGFLDSIDKIKFNRQKKILSKIYGSAIEKYLDKAANEPESEKFAICDLAIQDDEVIKGHYRNKILIGGRASTIFHSAFMVKAPISPELIKSVVILESNDFNYKPKIDHRDIMDTSIDIEM